MEKPESADQFRLKRRAKNWAIFAALMGFVLIVYFVALVRMGGG